MSASSEQMPWCIKVNEYTFQGTFDYIALLGRVLSSREANMKSQNCLLAKMAENKEVYPFIENQMDVCNEYVFPKDTLKIPVVHWLHLSLCCLMVNFNL